MKTYIVKAKDNYIITMNLLSLGGDVERMRLFDNTYIFITESTLDQILNINGVESAREETVGELQPYNQ